MDKITVKKILLCIVALLCLQIKNTATFADEYIITPPPEWIIQFTLEEPQHIPEDAISNGSYFILVDTQASPKGPHSEYFSHYAEKVVNQEGIEFVSQVSINFDPTYQMLLVHSINVHRAGQVIDKLDPDKISLLQREEELEAQIYDGSKTLNVILDDIRIGDIVEYSYTIQGANPVFQGLYYRDIGTQWRVPVHQFSHRLLWPKNKPLYIKRHGTEISPQIREINGLKEYIFSQKNIPAIIPDSDLPSWYSPYPWIQFSESATWAEIAQWGANLYTIPPELAPELESKIQEIMAESEKPEKHLIAALRFVQDEVRYMGIEIGPSSHLPHNPSLVLQRRFGDCKDKVLLLHTMLSAMGIESYPAAVNTRYRHYIRHWHPTPYAFNHVILMVNMKGTVYWIDPTRSYQRGSLQHLAQPDYRVALVLAEQTTELTSMDPLKILFPRKEIQERFVVRDGVDQPTDFIIETIYRGTMADYMREQFATESLDELEKSYLNYYASIYPDITATAPITINDDHYRNVITLKESYTIPNFWQLSEDENSLEASFYPLELYNIIEQPTTRQRSMPLYVPYPVYYQQTTRVQLPDNWNIEPLSVHLEDDAMIFDHAVRYQNRDLTITYEYRTKSDHLVASKVPEHISNLERIEDGLGYMIYTSREVPVASETSEVREVYTTREVPVASETSEVREVSWYDEINWTVLLLAIFTLCFGAIAAFKVYHYAPPVAENTLLLPDFKLRGIGGWLILVAFAVCFRPLYLLIQFPSLYPTYTKSQWSLLTMSGAEAYHPLWQPLFIFELVFNILSLVFSILMVILFFQKRYTFPKIYIIYLFTTLAGLTIDYFGAQSIPFIQEQKTVKDSAEIIRYGIFVVIWGLYFLKSRRVKNTFIETLPGQIKAVENTYQEI